MGAAARADDPATLRAEADRLAAENAALSTRAESALLELYAVESRLHRAEGEVARLEERVVVLEREERLARRRLELARTAEATAQKQLGDRLRALYVEGETDPIAVLLGATSLGDAIDVLDGLERFAEEDDRIIAQVQEARVSLRSALRTLTRRERELRALVAEAEAARAALAAAREEKAGYLDSLVRQRQLNESEILALEASAASAEREAAEIQASAPESSHAPAAVAVTQEEAAVAVEPAVEPAPAPSDGFDGSALSGGQVTVSMTMYCLTGFTATGIPVGPGVVATDPAVIPLGTRMSIPGYGDGVAADTGSGVQGLAIDAWVESCEPGGGLREADRHDHDPRLRTTRWASPCESWRDSWRRRSPWLAPPAPRPNRSHLPRGSARRCVRTESLRAEQGRSQSRSKRAPPCTRRTRRHRFGLPPPRSSRSPSQRWTSSARSSESRRSCWAKVSRTAACGAATSSSRALATRACTAATLPVWRERSAPRGSGE